MVYPGKIICWPGMVQTRVARPGSSKGVRLPTHPLRGLRACHPNSSFFEPSPKGSFYPSGFKGSDLF
jgi:hypothetical protein